MLLIVGAFLCLILSILVLFLLIWSTLIASYCEFSIELTTQSDFNQILTDLNI